jgi:hypothetical protein
MRTIIALCGLGLGLALIATRRPVAAALERSIHRSFGDKASPTAVRITSLIVLAVATLFVVIALIALTA